MKTITTANSQQLPADDILISDFTIPQTSILPENTNSQEEVDRLWAAALNNPPLPKPKSHLISEQDMEL